VGNKDLMEELPMRKKRLTNSRNWIILILISTGIWLSGCDKKADLKSGQIKISPSKLFDEKPSVLAYHLDIIPGAVDIEYNGPQKELSYGYEVWQDGEIIQPFRGGRTEIKTPYSGKFSISIKEVSECESPPKYKINCALSDENGYWGSGGYVEKAKTRGSNACGPRDLEQTTVFSEEDEIGVWGYMRGEGANGYMGNESVIDAAKRVEWAIVAKVKVGNAIR
jgi:hypothetical protein